jgi:hypothetical protein
MSAKRNRTKIAIFFVLALTISSCMQASRQENLYGVWKGQSRGVELVFRFFNDGTCEFSFKNDSSGTTERIRGNLETDFTKSPIPLTVRNIPQLNHPLHTIVEFIKDDSIRMAHFAPRWRLRPIAFGKNTSFSLKKVDRNPNARI